MDIVSILAAAAATWVFGAVWYMTLDKPWMAANGLSQEDVKRAGALPHIVSLIGAIVVATVMDHIFFRAGIDSVMGGLMVGFGLGAGIALPWMINTIMYGQRSRALIWLDGGYPVIDSLVMALVLVLL